MFGGMYIMGFLFALALGLYFRRNNEEEKGKVEFKKWHLIIHNIIIDLRPFLISLIVIETIIIFIDLTWAYYIGSILGFLLVFEILLIVGLIIQRLKGKIRLSFDRFELDD
ncbi:MAG: hypothetical protein QXT63_03315, partial [Thermoplasmata archaeon]